MIQHNRRVYEPSTSFLAHAYLSYFFDLSNFLMFRSAEKIQLGSVVF